MNLNSTIDTALRHVGLPLHPTMPTSISPRRYNQVLTLAHRRLLSKGISAGRTDVPLLLATILHERQYFSPPAIRPAPRILPVRVRAAITDMVTDVLSKQGFPPSQSATVVLPIYPLVVSAVAKRFQEGGFPISRLAIASDLKKRRYVPVQAKRRAYYASTPPTWRDKVAAKPPGESLSLPKGVFTGPKPIRVYPKVVRGAN